LSARLFTTERERGEREGEREERERELKSVRERERRRKRAKERERERRGCRERERKKEANQLNFLPGPNLIDHLRKFRDSLRVTRIVQISNETFPKKISRKLF
jgi:hypothetical protein